MFYPSLSNGLSLGKLRGSNINKTILNSQETYQKWRDIKLTNAITGLDGIYVEINNPSQLTQAEKQKIAHCIGASNFALYQFNINQYQTKPSILAINKQLGLVDYDKHLYSNTQGLAEISPSQASRQGEFVPYSNKNLNWHTDGYYNPINECIRCFSLFCVKQADNGGENEWIDHEMLYILLREKNQKLAKVLTQSDIMTVPEYCINGTVWRPECVGAVFFIDKLSGALMMRYTQRKRYITWKDTPEVAQAKAILENILQNKTQYHYHHKLQAGQGIICHNIIHKRHAFSNQLKTKPRLMIRGRYFNRVKI